MKTYRLRHLWAPRCDPMQGPVWCRSLRLGQASPAAAAAGPGLAQPAKLPPTAGSGQAGPRGSAAGGILARQSCSLAAPQQVIFQPAASCPVASSRKHSYTEETNQSKQQTTKHRRQIPRRGPTQGTPGVPQSRSCCRAQPRPCPRPARRGARHHSQR